MSENLNMRGVDNASGHAVGESDDEETPFAIDPRYADEARAGASVASRETGTVRSVTDDARRTGIKAVIESNVVTNERLPMLEVICERVVRAIATSMRNLTSDALDVTFEEITSPRFGDYMNQVELPAMFGVFRIAEWENYGLITVDSNLIYSVVDALLGGRKGARPERLETRAFTNIETILISKMAQLILDDFRDALEVIQPVSIQVDRMETSPRFAAIASPTNIAAVATFRVDMEGRGGRFSIMLPYATIEPVREKLLERFMGEKFGRDRIWAEHMANELFNTEVTLDVVLGEKAMSVRDLMNLEVGQTIALGTSPENSLQVQCAGVPLGRAHIGQRSNNIAISLSTEIAKGYPK